jgi:antitoxin CcdA
MRMAKKAVNLSVDADLLARARKADVNLSATFEEALRGRIHEEEQARWRSENARAIEAYNDFVREHGVFGEGLRLF